MRVSQLLIAAALLVSQWVYAAVPSAIVLDNATPYPFYFRWQGFDGFAFTQFVHNTVPYNYFSFWFTRDTGGHGGLMIDTGSDVHHQQLVFSRPLPLIATGRVFSLPRQGQVGQYQGHEIIFDATEKGSVVTFRVIALPLTNKGVHRT